jgi:EAL domain-containing protein (putative c-di-GMP-specific phosphodiesterase class I)
MNNGDKLLRKIAKNIDEFFKTKGIKKPVFSHYKGGNFLILLDGEQGSYATIFDLFLTKIDDSIVDDIELKCSGSIIDTDISDDFEKLVDRLFELRIESQLRDSYIEKDEINLSELENSVIDAINSKRVSIMGQKTDMGDISIVDISVKLIDKNEKLIHQKRFIPIVTRLGMRESYELIKLENVLKKIDINPKYLFAVTIAAEVLRNTKFKTDVKRLITDTKECRLIFILEEKEYFSNIKYFDNILQDYRKLGIKIALDALGNNHTTQLYMKDLHVDIIRFDSTYGKKLHVKRYQSIVEGLNLTAHKIGLLTWIRFIGDEDSAKIARDMKIDVISGNYFSKIEPIENKGEL